jgi:hypothetical protein
MGWAGMFRPGMRAYLIPLVAGAVLAISAFLPWVIVGDIALSGFPDVLALWVIGLGVLASALATLSLITRKNSRHPLLIVGLAALAITFLSWRIMPDRIAERALLRAQAVAIVEHTGPVESPDAHAGVGLGLGIGASVAIVLFGLTIVVRRASQAYAVVDTDDDV